MVKHCTKCRRRWIVSIFSNGDYICPGCEGGHEITKLVDGHAIQVLV